MRFQLSIGPNDAVTGDRRQALFQMLAQLLGLVYFRQLRHHLAHHRP